MSFHDKVSPILLPSADGMRGSAGTSDAVARVLPIAIRWGDTEVLLLSVDQVHAMDYAPMIAAPRASGAVVTVAATKTDLETARGLGVITADAFGIMTRFEENPAYPTAMSSDPGRALVSMGIYVFNRGWLEAALA